MVAGKATMVLVVIATFSLLVHNGDAYSMGEAEARSIEQARSGVPQESFVPKGRAEETERAPQRLGGGMNTNKRVQLVNANTTIPVRSASLNFPLSKIFHSSHPENDTRAPIAVSLTNDYEVALA
ncbi:uncharacterized protein LOC144146821 [Haemaphysalis longicornis]